MIKSKIYWGDNMFKKEHKISPALQKELDNMGIKVLKPCWSCGAPKPTYKNKCEYCGSYDKT
jgi:hypothetical protein